LEHKERKKPNDFVRSAFVVTLVNKANHMNLSDRDFISFAAFGDTYRWQCERRNESIAKDAVAVLLLVLCALLILSIGG